MRITNKIMQNNNLYNINRNKVLEDKLSTEMSTGKNITRPSDDPVVAIRALRLRTNVSTTTQYYKKNIPDAQSWLETTEDALGSVSAVLTDMVKQAGKGANEDLGSEDLSTIMEQLTALSDELYATGDTDYAGRYIFTGYRTDTSLTFQEESTDVSYKITEQLGLDAFDDVTYVDTKDLFNMNSTTYAASATTEQDISSNVVHRIRLAYEDMDAVTAANPITLKQGSTTYSSADASITTYNSAEEAEAAIAAANKAGTTLVAYSATSGELFVSDDVYTDMMASTDEIQVTYGKTKFADGDFRPEHYYACTTTDADGNTIDYNSEYLTGSQTKQAITYDVGANQSIQVNTTADEVFEPGIRRDVTDLQKALEDLVSIEATQKNLKEALADSTDTTEKAEIQEKLDAANKAYTYLRDNVNTMFGSAITKFQGYLDDTNIAITANGSRSKRLELVETRLSSQKTTFETLQSENEDIDISEASVELKSSELAYEASLMATSRILQTSLLNYL
ncbi:MAG: flagellin [Lachnospiraceae bacterium]|nr:flagellin [Lachnospiraceae bacterium]